jgi:hypothetical protein
MTKPYSASSSTGVPYADTVKNYNVDTKNVGNTAVIREHTPIGIVDSDTDLAERFQREADTKRAMISSEAQQLEAEIDFEAGQLSPFEQRINLEKYYTPIIKALTAKHVEACDAVEEFESDQLRFRASLQAEFAYRLRHPDIITKVVQGDYHFNQMLSGGHIDVEGYRLIERRSNGGAISMVTGNVMPAQGSFTLVYIPIGVPNLMSYAQSPEAIAASQHEYNRDLQRLIAKRKAAAVKLTEIKQSARAALAAIPSFDDLISDSVKRALKK